MIQLRIQEGLDHPRFGKDDAQALDAWCTHAQSQDAIPAPLCTEGTGRGVVETMVLRRLVPLVQDQTLILLCPHEDALTLYRQMYNFWFASTKAERL